MAEAGEQVPVSRAVATLRRVWTDYGQGRARQEDVMLVLNAVADLAQLEQGRLEEQASQAGADPQNSAYQLAQQGWELHLEAVETMAQEFEEPGQGRFEEGLELAQEADRSLAQAHRQMVEQIEARSRVACMFCGRDNPRGSTRCGHCGRSLQAGLGGGPQSSFSAVQGEAAAAPPSGGERVTANYAYLAQAVAAFRADQKSMDELLGAIEEVEGRLVAHQESNSQRLEGLEEEAPEPLAQALGRTDERLQESLAAIDKMKLFFDKRNDSYLMVGLDDFKQASQALLEVFRELEGLARKT